MESGAGMKFYGDIFLLFFQYFPNRLARSRLRIEISTFVMFRISEDPLDISALSEGLEHPKGGAFVTFEGRVRNHSEGKSVEALDYQAYKPLAEAEGAKIIEEAVERFDLLACVCIHRVGHLEIGGLAVWVGVTAAHRAEAFESCRFVIDEVKKRVPIWKKEKLNSGESHWVACHDESASGPT
jgi:molybdopterin synthase catalytic subunit